MYIELGCEREWNDYWSEVKSITILPSQTVQRNLLILKKVTYNNCFLLVKLYNSYDMSFKVADCLITLIDFGKKC